MKIYEYIKGENERTAKLFGVPIMEQTSDYMTAERLQKFLGGIVTTHKTNDPDSDYSKKEIKLFGYSIVKRIEENNYRNYYMFGKIVHKISLLEQFKKEFSKYYSGDYDDVYILRANSGETYLTLTYVFDALLKRNQSKKPLFIATLKYHIDMIKMICPDIPYVYAKKLRIKIQGTEFNLDNKRFFLLFDNMHFKNVENEIKNSPLGQAHYFKSIMKKLNMTEADLTYRKITVHLEDERSMLAKVSKLGLNLDKFVFLAPEAQSCKLYDEDFWCELINQFQAKGYDVFVNLTDEDIKLRSATNYKTCDLTFAEAFALARRSKKIVSLRSGFTEFLLQTNVPMDVLYTKFKYRHFFDDMDIYHVMSGFGLTQLPFVDKEKIKEFNMFEMSQIECIYNILKQSADVKENE